MNESPTLREIYKAGKKFFTDAKNNPNNPNLNHLLKMDISEKEFSEYRLNIALNNIYRDIISPVEILSSKTQLLENVLPFISPTNPSALGGFALGLKDILYKSMTTEEDFSYGQKSKGVYFGKIWIPEIGKDIVVELLPEHIKTGSYSFSSLPHQYDIIEGCWAASPLIHKTVFKYPFKTLYLLYQFIQFYSKNSHKIILYKNGLSHLASADLRKMDALRTQLLEQAQDVVSKNLLVLDADDRFEIPTLKLDQADQIMDFVYTELANMLLVPQTKIRGTAPSGMNATGEYDDINYAKTLQGFRETYLYPVLTALKIDYTTKTYTGEGKLCLLQDFPTHWSNIQAAGLGEEYRNTLWSLLKENQDQYNIPTKNIEKGTV